jgi:hypothetical protein
MPRTGVIDSECPEIVDANVGPCANSGYKLDSSIRSRAIPPDSACGCIIFEIGTNDTFYPLEMDMDGSLGRF